MRKLYPLKFKATTKERPWGGRRLIKNYNKPEAADCAAEATCPPIGESWEVVGFPEDSSIISNGFLEGNSLFEAIETYMGDLVGEEIYKEFGNEFPLLIKLLDINEKLSVQVHPDDETAFDRHNSYGKTEAWYILDADEDAKIYMGFNRDITPTEFYERCKNTSLEEILNAYHPKKGDFFYVESGIVHAAYGGIVIAEVQQLSDVTYRIYDWGRENDPKTAREMHLDLSIDSINYKKYEDEKYYSPAAGQSTQLTNSKYFTINKIKVDKSIEISSESMNRFTLYFCVEGSIEITPDKGNDKYGIEKGEWVLVPASYEDYTISSINNAEVLEVFIQE